MIGLLLAALLASAPERCLYEAQIEWPVVLDEDVVAYVLERSDDRGETWDGWLTVDQGPGQFFLRERRAYRVRDEAALDGTRYRLRVVDELGNASEPVDLTTRERTLRRCIR